MKIEFRESFLKDLQVVKNVRLRAKVREAIENIEEAETPQEIQNFKKLKGTDSIIESGLVNTV